MQTALLNVQCERNHIFIENNFSAYCRSHMLFNYLKTSKARLEEMTLLIIVVVYKSFPFGEF